MNRTLVFDMDGTIADLYGVQDWLYDLRHENPHPYEVARPLYDMEVLNMILQALQNQGWHIVVTSWLSKDSTREYDNAVRKAKKDWLDKYDFPYNEIHFIKYGTTKANCTRKRGGRQILVDDNEKVRAGWTLGETIDATNDIIRELINLIKEE